MRYIKVLVRFDGEKLGRHYTSAPEDLSHLGRIIASEAYQRAVGEKHSFE